MAEPSRRVERVHGGLLPSGVPADLGRDQSGFAALSRGFSDVGTVADQISALRDASDRTRVQGELNQAVRDEAAENRQGIADGSIDPAQFDAGDDLDFYVDDRVAKLESRFAEIARNTDNTFELEKLDRAKQEIISATREQAQIQQVAALATRVAQDQAEAANSIGADVGIGEKTFELGLAQLSDLRESAPLSAERARELEVKQTTNLVLGGVTGSITRAAFDDAIAMIDHPDTIDAMSAKDRETLRAQVIRAKERHRSDTVSKMGEKNKLLVDTYKREIDQENPTVATRIEQDKRLLPGQKDDLTILRRDKDEWRFAVDRDKAVRDTDPHSLSEKRLKELDSIEYNKLYRDTLVANPDLSPEEALRVADFRFAEASGGLPAPTTYSRMLAAADDPTVTNLEYLMTMYDRIGKDHPNLLAARADMDVVRSLYHETQIHTEMGIPIADTVATRQAERNRSKQQQEMIDANWDLITEEHKQDDFDFAVGQDWIFSGNKVGFDTLADMRIRSTWATMFATAFQQTGSRKLATARAASWLNARWGSFSMSPIISVDELPPMEYPPDKFVQDIDKLGGKWWHEDTGADLVNLGFLRDTSPQELARVTIYVTDRTRATLRDTTDAKTPYHGIQYGVKIDGEVEALKNGQLLHIGAVFPESATYKIGVRQRLDAYNEYENGADVADARKKGKAVAGKAGDKLAGYAKEAEQFVLDTGMRMLQYEGRPTKGLAEDLITQRELDKRREISKRRTEQSQ